MKTIEVKARCWVPHPETAAMTVEIRAGRQTIRDDVAKAAIAAGLATEVGAETTKKKASE